MLRATLCLLLATAAVAIAACGSGSGAGSDPAEAVPRGALLYVEGTLRPEGDVRDGALAAAGKILHTADPGARIRSLVTQALSAGGPHIDFARDVDPWMGDRAALWVDAPPRAGEDPPGAAAIAVRDEDQARKKFEELARRGGEPLREHGDYQVTGDGDALAVRDGYAYIGDEAPVRRALAAADDARLADADAYRDAISDLPDERLGTYYLDTRRFFDAAILSDPEAAENLGPARSLFEGDLRPVAGAFTADGDRLTLESVATTGGQGTLGVVTGGEAPDLMRELPGDSWAALGVPKAGESLRAVFGRLAGAFGGAALEGRLRQELGIDLQQDVFAWMGDAAVFVRGTTQDTLGGGLVVQVTDEERAARAFGKFVGLARTRGGLDTQPVQVPGADAAFDLGVPNAPRPVILARGNGRVVLAYGREAAAAGLQASEPLGDSTTYGDARDALGGYDPALIVSMPAIVSLVESSGSADADFEAAKPYLDAFGVIASGAKRDGDKVRSRFAAGLRP